MALNQYQWAVDFLKTIGNINPTDDTIAFVVAWEKAEGTSATFNPLATTQYMPGSTNFNSVGVKNYASYADGLTANAFVLRNGLYPSLLHALMTNDENNLGFHSHSIANNIAGDLSVWVSGQRVPINSNYVGNIWSISSGKGDTTTGTSPVSTQSQTANSLAPNIAALNSIGDFFSMLGSLISNPTRLLKGAIGSLLIVIGVVMMVQQFAPGLSKAVKVGLM